jgi:hypothetical protein
MTLDIRKLGEFSDHCFTGHRFWTEPEFLREHDGISSGVGAGVIIEKCKPVFYPRRACRARDSFGNLFNFLARI